MPAVIIYWSEADALWLAVARDFTGLATHGETPEAALANFREAAALWAEAAAAA